MSELEHVKGGRGLTRRDLEAVVRRAAELSAAERDADERLSPDEVLRIAGELGLPERHVRQALYELDDGREEGDSFRARFVRQRFGPAVLTSARVVPEPPERALARLEDYLVSREYLQLRRRQGTAAWLEPADDAVSSVTRALTRLSRRLHLARAERVRVSAQPLEEGRAYVRLQLDFEGRRRESARNGMLLGGGLGAVIGGAVLSAAGVAGILLGSPEAGVAVGALAGLGSAAGSARAILRSAAARFRRETAQVATEAESLLDRLERGERLEPPATPLMRRIRSAAADGLDRLPPPRR